MTEKDETSFGELAAADKLQVLIDITDWLQEVRQSEITVLDDDDVLQRIDEGLPVGEIAKTLEVMRELGLASSEVLPGNKLMLYMALQAQIRQKVKAATKEVTMPSGKNYELPIYLGKPGRPPKQKGASIEGEEETVFEASETTEDKDERKCSYVRFDTAAAVGYAHRYLTNTIPGFVFNSLKVLAANDEDVVSVANELHDAIDEQVARLVKPEEQVMA